MNNPLPLLGTALLLSATSSAFAASSTDLTVTGTITPSACAPTLSDGGIVDHGKLTARDLDPLQPTRLPAGEMQLEVHCEGSTFFTLTTVDNRAGTSAIKEEYHGLGVVNEDQKLGSVSFGVFDPQADGRSVLTIISRDNGASWRASTYLGHAGMTSFAAPGDPHTPIAIKDLNARLRAFTIIAPADDLTLVDELPIDGHATLQLKYL